MNTLFSTDSYNCINVQQNLSNQAKSSKLGLQVDVKMWRSIQMFKMAHICKHTDLWMPVGLCPQGGHIWVLMH